MSNLTKEDIQKMVFFMMEAREKAKKEELEKKIAIGKMCGFDEKDINEHSIFVFGMKRYILDQIDAPVWIVANEILEEGAAFIIDRWHRGDIKRPIRV